MTSCSAIIVTRGDVSLAQILRSLSSHETIVWDNSFGGQVTRWPLGSFATNGTQLREPETLILKTAGDLAVYGRYAAIEYASGDLIYVQDDDCIVPVEEVLAAYEPGRLVANMPEGRWSGYPDSVMVGWGACFDRDLPMHAFDRYLTSRHDGSLLGIGGLISSKSFPTALPSDEIEFFHRTCDIVFSMLTPRTVIDVGFQHLPWAEGPGRMFTTDNTRHNEERNRMIELCRQIRTWPDDDVRIPRDA